MMQMNKLETKVLELLLRGDNKFLACLRDQLKGISIKEREISSAGFFTTFEVDETAKLVTNNSFKISDVHGEISGLEHGAGFILYVSDGKLELLEGYSYDERWPNDIDDFELTYINDHRDLEKLRSTWM